jgi:hypothetical protein
MLSVAGPGFWPYLQTQTSLKELARNKRSSLFVSNVKEKKFKTLKQLFKCFQPFIFLNDKVDK